MQNLFIFGDSFGDVENHKFSNPMQKQWPDILRELLEVHTKKQWNLENCCLLGSSQDFSWYAFRNAIKFLKPDDLVVFLLTDQSRFWFLEQRPDITNAATIDLDSATDPDVNQTIAGYFRHISRPSLDQIRTTVIVENIDYWANRLPQTKFLVIPCFPLALLGPQTLGTVSNDNKEDAWDFTSRISKTQGNLLHVQQREFSDTNKDYWRLKNWRGWDIRYCHLTLDNHRVLAKKLFRSYVDGIAVDLTTGFKQNIFDEKMLDVNNIPDKLLPQLNPKTIEHVKSINEPGLKESWLNRFVFDKKSN